MMMISLYYFFQSPVTFCLFGSSIFNTLSSKAHSLFFPHKTGKLIVLYFIKFVTFDSKGTILPNGRSIPSVQYALFLHE